MEYGGKLATWLSSHKNFLLIKISKYSKIKLEFCKKKAPILLVRNHRKLHEILHVQHGLIIVMNDSHLSRSHRAAEYRNDQFLRLLSLICLCKRHFNASEEMRLNKIRITGCERGGSRWLGLV